MNTRRRHINMATQDQRKLLLGLGFKRDTIAKYKEEQPWPHIAKTDGRTDTTNGDMKTTSMPDLMSNNTGVPCTVKIASTNRWDVEHLLPTETTKYMGALIAESSRDENITSTIRTPTQHQRHLEQLAKPEQGSEEDWDYNEMPREAVGKHTHINIRDILWAIPITILVLAFAAQLCATPWSEHHDRKITVSDDIGDLISNCECRLRRANIADNINILRHDERQNGRMDEADGRTEATFVTKPTAINIM